MYIVALLYQFTLQSCFTIHIYYIKLLIPDEWVGSIIGKGGATLRALTEETGAKFWIPGESPAGSTQRPITISGPAGGVALGVAFSKKKNSL
jgi:hypothetical protein